MNIDTLIKKQMKLSAAYQLAIHRAVNKATNSQNEDARLQLEKKVESINKIYIPLALKLGMQWLST